MGRAIFLSTLVSSLVSLVVTLTAVNVVPKVAQAQLYALTGESFAIVGPNGQEQVQAWARPSGGGILQTLSADGQVRAALGTGGGQPSSPLRAGTNFWTPGGFESGLAPAARLGVDPGPEGDAVPNLLLRDQDDNLRVLSTLNSGGSPVVALLDRDGHIRASMNMADRIGYVGFSV